MRRLWRAACVHVSRNVAPLETAVVSFTIINGGSAQTTATSFSPASNLAVGAHTLYVQERNAAGTWSSNSATFAF